LYSEKFERFEASFAGAGDTLSAALSALLANGHDLQSATAEALTYLDQSLNAGFQPGMGHLVPDRMFWAQAEDDETPEGANTPTTLPASATPFDMNPHGTKH
jgi:hydroxymethylpyrimidine/phosphomethylpyrimidine kinase